MSAQVNGVPLHVESEAGPADGPAAPGELDLRVNADLGEVTLQGKAEGIDLHALALASAQVELVGPDAGYLLGVLNLPTITSGPLHLEATLAPDPGHSAFSASGRLGDYRLEAEGWFEDARGADGFDVRWHIAGPDLAVLGQRLATVDLPAAPFEMTGTIRSQGNRIDIDDATMTVGEMTFRAQATVAGRDGGGRDASLQVRYRDLSGRLTAATTAGLSLDGADLDFALQGPDAGAAARAVGLDGLGAIPFAATGRGTYQTGMLALDAASLEIGEQSLRLSGRVGARPPGAGTDLRFTAEDVDLSPWLDTAARRFLALKTVSGTGRVRVSDERLTLDALSLAAGDIALTGNVTHSVGTDGAEFALELTGPNAAAAARPLGVEGLSAERFSLSGRGAYASGELVLDTAQLRLGAQRLAMTGRLLVGSGDGEADMRFDAEKLDLSSWLAAKDYLAPAVQTISGTGRLRRSGEWLNLDELSMTAGPASLTGELAVHVGGRGDSGRFELRFEAPSVAGLSPALDHVRVVDERVEVSGTGAWTPRGWELRDAAVQLSDRGELRGSLDYIRGERPFVSVALTAERLDLRSDDKQSTEAPADRNDGRVIPDRAIPFDWLGTLDADFRVDVDSLRSPEIAGALFRMAGTLRDGRLEITNLETNGKRGRLTGTLTAEPVEPAESAYAIRLYLEGRNLYIARPDETGAVLAARPAYDMTAKLEARGADVRALADTLTGRIRVEARAGEIPRRENLLSTLVFEDTLTRILETINPRIGKRDDLQLNCLVVRLELEDGTARGDPLFALQTGEVNLLARGRVDLGSETLDLDILAQPRRGLGISLGDLINPFTRVGGTLASPRIVADPKSAILETGAGLATGGLWPLGRKLLQRLFGSDACTRAMEAGLTDN
ncbi:MAG: AsmA-like C-terminal region-containing protein [Gammaproteobacteria bacterium]